jgi:hypothetical protein
MLEEALEQQPKLEQERQAQQQVNAKPPPTPSWKRA